jgi:phosphatidylserine decarboxylase
LVGAVASATLPGPLRGLAYRAFARAVGANLAETELDLREYRSLGDFFTRKLRHGARTIDAAPDAIVSPCDGAVAAAGIAKDGTLVQAKGHTYSLAELVADDAFAQKLVGGAYCTIYLSPRDYHRVHTPVAGELVRYDYVPGLLWPVNRWATQRREGLLSRNERVVIRLNAGALGDVAVVMVGAMGVGNIRLFHPEPAGQAAQAIGAPDSATLRGAAERTTIELDNIRVEKGDELGAFRLGSTVVLLFGPQAVELADLQVNQALRVGERIGTIGGRA